MGSNLRSFFRNTSWDRITSLSAAKLFAVLFVIALPGGLLLPACYGVYVAIRRRSFPE